MSASRSGSYGRGGAGGIVRPALHTPVRQSSLREHNLALVLRLVYEQRPGPGSEPGGAPVQPPGPRSRADLAAVTGLSPATVSGLVDELIGADLLTETPAPRGAVGRPAVGLAVSPDGAAGLGLEVNVDYLAASVVDLAGAVRHRELRRADQRPRQPADVLAELAELAERAAAVAAVAGVPLAGATLAVPGLVEGQRVRMAPHLGWLDVAMPARLADLPVAVDNESNLGALGERAANPLLPPTFVYLSGEIGIGAGIVLGGALMRGARGFGGEVGHLTIHPDGPVCRCGSRGCLELYAGQDAIRAAAGRPGPPGEVPPGVSDFIALAQAGNLPMRHALDQAAQALGLAIAGLVNLLDVPTVVLGGAFGPLEPLLRDGIAEEISRRVVSAGWAPVDVVPSVLGSEAAVRGAAGAALQTVLDHPVAWIARP